MNALCTMRRRVAVLAGALAGVCPSLLQAQTVNFNVPLYGSIDKPTRPFFRVGGLQVAGDGSLIAFGEAKQKIDDPGRGDGLSDIVMKKSLDGGQTWSTIRTLYANNFNDYCGATPVLDRSTNNIYLHFTETPNLFASNGTFVSKGYGTNTFHSFVMSSSDHGTNWTTAQVITPQVKDVNWDIFGAGPTTGIQLRWQTNPARNGRMIMTASRSDGPTAASLAIYSDAHGAVGSWTRGGDALSAQTTEADIVELTNGDLLMNARCDNGGPRMQFFSSDGGQSWGPAQALDVPVTPVDTNLIRYSAKRDGDDRDRLLFSAPLGEPMGGSSGANYNDRYNLGVWTSYDEGKTYINPRQISNGWAGYTNMQKLPDGNVGMMYESNFSYVDAEVRYVNFGMSFVEGQTHQRELTHYDGFGNTIDRLRGGMGWSGSWTGTSTIVPTGTLSFTGFQFPTEAGRADLVNGQSLQRKLATPVDLNSNSTTYLSLLLSNKFDASSNGTTNEAFSLDLQDSTGTTQATIGVSSTEQFLVSALGSAQSTAAGSAVRSATYFLVAKIVSRDAASGGNYDQLYLKVYQSGVDTIPLDDSLLGWTLVGGTDENSAALLDRVTLSGGSSVRWSLDEFRIGTTFASVASNGVMPTSTWVASASGDWNFTGNWTGGVPNAAGVKAVFAGSITSPQTVFTNSAVTIGSLRFDNAQSYMISGQGSLTLQMGSGTASVEVVQGSHKINLPSIFASNTNITVANGATLTIGNPMRIKANKIVTNTGAVVIQAPLIIESGGVFNLGAGPAAVVSGAPSLASGARINVQDNSLIVDYHGQASPAATIQRQLASGYNDGAWDGEGINTSSANASRGLGWKETTSSESILIQYTYYGDVNLDGAVDSSDFNAFVSGYGAIAEGNWSQGDFNYDGRVNTLDFNQLAGNFGAAAAVNLGAVVPEPSSVVLAAPLMLLSTRRRRNGRAHRCSF
jgi:sialidase-1